MEKKKYVFIGNIASPIQVKFSDSLQEYFDAEFWFYEHLNKVRPSWWKIPLGENNKILKYSGHLPLFGYYSLGVFYNLFKFKPDIVVLGGFMKWHLIIVKLIRLFRLDIKIAIMTEPFRYTKNDESSSEQLLSKKNSPQKLKLTKKMFEDVDLYIGMGKVAEKQLLEEFEFPTEKVASLVYPQDIEACFNHPLRIKNKNDEINFLFASRLVSRYEPLIALESFAILSSKYSNINLFMNNSGSLKTKCESFIKEKNLKNVYFLNDIQSWNHMHLIYKNADVLLLPAKYSNGSNALIEARASGMGVVMSNQIYNVQKHSIDGENCFICEPTTAEFIRNMEKYILDTSIIRNHGELSKKLIEDRRNIHTAKRYHRVFKSKGFV